MFVQAVVLFHIYMYVFIIYILKLFQTFDYEAK